MTPLVHGPAEVPDDLQTTTDEAWAFRVLLNALMFCLAILFAGLATGWNGWAMGALAAALIFIGARPAR
jgi:hypothetical protein